MLPAHWGGRWGEIRKEILSKFGEEALESLLTAEFLPYEEVEPEIRDEILQDEVTQLDRIQTSFPAEVTDANLREILLREGKPDDAHGRSVLRSIVTEYEANIVERALELTKASMDYRRRIWEEGLYVVAPGCNPGDPNLYVGQGEGEGGNGSINGWTYEYYLGVAGDPAYGQARERLAALCNERDGALRRAAQDL